MVVQAVRFFETIRSQPDFEFVSLLIFRSVFDISTGNEWAAVAFHTPITRICFAVVLNCICL